MLRRTAARVVADALGENLAKGIFAAFDERIYLTGGHLRSAVLDTERDYVGDIDLVCEVPTEVAISRLRSIKLPMQRTRLGGVRLTTTLGKTIDVFSTRLNGATPRAVEAVFRYYNLHNNAAAVSLDGTSTVWSKYFWSDNPQRLARIPPQAFSWMATAHREGALLRVLEKCHELRLSLVDNSALKTAVLRARQTNPHALADWHHRFRSSGQVQNADLLGDAVA